MGLDELLDFIIHSAAQLAMAEESSLMLIDEGNNRLVFHNVSSTSHNLLKEISIPMDQGIAGYVARTGESVLIDDVQNDSRWFSKVDDETNFITKSIIAVPMKTMDKVIGVIEVINSKVSDMFTNLDLFLLESLGDQAAIAISNRRLLINYEEKVEELKALYDLSNASENVLTYEELFNKALPLIVETLSADKAVALMKKSEGFIIKGIYGFEEDLLDEEIHISYTRSNNSLFSESHNTLHQGAFITLPMIAQNQVMGVVSISRNKEDPFNHFDLRLLSTIVNQISESCENIRMYQEEQEQKRIQKELEVMQKLQQSILPKDFNIAKSIQICGFNAPALEVGGDFFDIFQLKDDKIGIVVADVSGKGMPAALFMALTRSVIKANALLTITPANVLELSNDLMYMDSEAGMFVTAFYLVIDEAAQKFIYANAGHNPQFLFKAATNEVEILPNKRKPLGVVPNVVYEEVVRNINKGDILFLFTDGVIEAFNEELKEFGEERIKDFLKLNKDSAPKELIDKLYHEITTFVGDTKQFDDITMIAVKF